MNYGKNLEVYKMKLRPRGILTIVLAIYLAAELLTGVIGMFL